MAKKKSSLKTFLAGKNPYGIGPVLKNSEMLEDKAPGTHHDGCWADGHEYWNVDVLDDGTAITYSPTA